MSPLPDWKGLKSSEVLSGGFSYTADVGEGQSAGQGHAESKDFRANTVWTDTLEILSCLRTQGQNTGDSNDASLKWERMTSSLQRMVN